MLAHLLNVLVLEAERFPPALPTSLSLTERLFFNYKKHFSLKATHGN